MHAWPRIFQRLGWPGLLGVACMVLALWAQSVNVPAVQAQTEAAQGEADRLRSALRQATARAAQPEAPKATGEQAWQALWHALPEAGEHLALQQQVWRSAQTVGLELPSMQVQAQREAWVGRDGAPQALWRQRMQLPVEAPYEQVRQWVQALQTIQGLSVDGLDLQRADPAVDVVKAQVRLSLWWRSTERRP